MATFLAIAKLVMGRCIYTVQNSVNMLALQGASSC